MGNDTFKHIDPDEFHDSKLSLHDCIADYVSHTNGILCFHFPNGFWVTPDHDENQCGNTVRTDASLVSFTVEDMDDITIRVFTRNTRCWSTKTIVEYWHMEQLISAVNSGKCTLEFITQYRTHFEQMWQCAIRFKKKPYKVCELFLPNTTATFYWNNLCLDREW